jgi:peptide-methionine (R)-S-oxide reductase
MIRINNKKIMLPGYLSVMILMFGFQACAQKQEVITKTNNPEMEFEVKKPEAEWKKELTPMQYSVLREKATERPYTGIYDKFNEIGTYYCAACGEELFESKTKFDAGCGWPSFYDPAKPHNVTEIKDSSHGMIRTEVVCSKCGGHLGHVFDDGPEPTGKRYCINSASLVFKKR